MSSGTFPIWIRTERFDDPRSPVSEMALANRGVTLLCRQRIFCEASDVKPRCLLIQVRDDSSKRYETKKVDGCYGAGISLGPSEFILVSMDDALSLKVHYTASD